MRIPPHGKSTGKDLTKEEVERLLRLYNGQAPDWLAALCEKFDIPIPD